MNSAYLLLGGNIGKVGESFSKALEKISSDVGNIIKTSPVYYSEPWGFESKNMFHNQAIQIDTALNPHEILSSLLSIESSIGRTRKKEIVESRKIDIDILLYNNLIINDNELQIPHPRMHLRKFTLVPLSDIAPNEFHPLFKKTIVQLLESCDDTSEVIPL